MVNRALGALIPLVSAMSAEAAPARVPPHRIALIVAENQPVAGGDLTPLRYADDDGLRYAALLRMTGAQVELLTVLDAETQRRNPGAASGTRPPTREALGAAMGRINATIDAAHAAGQTVDFYFVFAGHGEVGANGEGQMHLHDGTLSRAELLERVVGTSRADFNHLIIDACHAQALVFNRGPADDGYRPEDYRGAIADYLDQQDLRAYPNTGAILATTAGRETHEWEVFGAGIFSHEVRSGLAGVADANADGAIEYSELAAYVHAANDAITHVEARPQVVFRPPQSDRNRPILAYQDGPRSFLRIPKSFQGRAWIEDTRGNRYADFHGSGEAPIVLALASDTVHYLRRERAEVRIEATGAGVIDEAHLAWRPRDSTARGALSDAFQRHLYGRPFGPAYYAGFVASSGDVPAIRHQTSPLPADATATGKTTGMITETRFGAWPWVTTVAAAALSGVAVWQGLAARDEYERFDRTLASEGTADGAQVDRIEQAQALAVAFGAAGLATAGAAVALFVLDGPVPSTVTLVPSPGGLVLGGRF